MALSPSTTATLPPSDLWNRLPPELRVDIYKFAYVEESKITRVLLLPTPGRKTTAPSKASPDIKTHLARFDQWHLSLATYDERGTIVAEIWHNSDSFFKSLSDLLVSRQWLDEALPIFIRNNHFEFCYMQTLCGFVATHPFTQANITTITVLYPFCNLTPSLIAYLVNSCPKLKEVTLRWDIRQYLPGELQGLREYLKTGGNLKSLVAPAVVNEISRLRGLDRLAIDMKACGEGLDDMARELEEEFRGVVSQPRDFGGAEQVRKSF